MTQSNWNSQSQPQQPQSPQPKPKKPLYKRVWFWLLVIVVLVATVSALTSGGDSTDPTTNAPASGEAKTADKTAKKPEGKKAADKPAVETKPTERLVLEKGYKFVNDEFSPMVTGTVSNNSDKPVKLLVTITFNAYDESGANVGTCTDSTESIDANGKWKFKAYCLDQDVAKVKFKDLSGF
ncbi:FxLYD domain-containing protein [Cutibacterium equinum]|uniref:FxLYD domain-containing protein n=1 Tax=Cutibacterium equinum TaxID=3016342 RepID=A0ABY7R0E6_9ACTN|nr:FxLYD domain-containing protein [Cutibacterium equinum]WCC80219.1 FxLYD domain-containing protein [Cutibacterium equinum]